MIGLEHVNRKERKKERMNVGQICGRRNVGWVGGLATFLEKSVQVTFLETLEGFYF